MLFFAMTATLAASVPVPVRADNLDEEKKRVDDAVDVIQEQLAGTSAELQRSYQQLAAAQQELSVAQGKLAAAQAKEAEAARKDAELATRLKAAERAEADAQAELAEGQRAIEETEEAMGEFAARVYRDSGISPQLTLLLGSKSPDDFANRSAMVDYVLRQQGGSMRRLEEQRAGMATVQDRLVSVREQITELKRLAAENLERAKAARAEAARQEQAVQRAVDARKAAAAKIQSRKSEEDARLAELQSEQNKLAAELRRRAEKARPRKGGSPGRTGPTGGLLNNPVPGSPMTSRFGMRMHPIYHYPRMHSGLDFGAGCGTPVYAAEAGQVIRASTAGGYGKQVVVDHGWVNGAGLATSYSHLSRFAVRGGSVKRGQLIAYVGSTGASTGCHLHFEVRV
ncbi:MAG: peptidase M23, partial [Micrococcales bacterium]